MNRSGAALILAIVILAALLLLGLPFLFSQSASLTGTRSLADHQAASVGRDAAENLGVAVAAHARAGYDGVGGASMATELLADVGAAGIAAGAPDPRHRNQLPLDLGVAPLDYNSGGSSPALPVRRPPLLGVTIEDESGKLDPNHLDTAGWSRLMTFVGIADWDDDYVLDSEDDLPDPPGGGDQDGVPGTSGNADQNGDNDDREGKLTDDPIDDYGELAEALAAHRFTLPGDRYTQLEQLLEADPGHNVDALPPANVYTDNSPPTGAWGFRRRLTRAELELLRPYLSLHNLGQGREGLVDLGTVIVVSPTGPHLDSAQPPIAPGTVLVNAGTPSAPRIPYQREQAFRRFPQTPGALGPLEIRSGWLGAANDRLAISVPPEVNIHQAEPAVRRAFGFDAGTDAQPPQGAPLLNVSQLDTLDADLLPGFAPLLTGFDLQDPLATGRELPPLAVASGGMVAIESAAVTTDPQGRQTAQQRRRIVAQAVAQEQAIERRWLTQGQFHHLLAARQGSRLAAWPRGYQRIDDLLPDESPAVGSVDHTAALKAAPLPGFADRRPLRANEQLAPHLDADPSTAWQRVFRGTVGDFRARGRMECEPLSGPSLGSLTPEGIELVSGTRLVYPLVAPPADPALPASETGGFLTHDQVVPTQLTREIHGRQISLWVRPTTAWSGVVPLVDVRMPVANAGRPLAPGVDAANAMLDARALVGSNELQNLVNLSYDSVRRHLVLTLNNGAIEHIDDVGPQLLEDRYPNPIPLVDPRCYAATTMPSTTILPVIAPKRPWNQIQVRYKVGDATSPGGDGMRPGASYLVQAAFANNAPGGMAITVNQVVGREVTRLTVTPALTEAGDHVTLPSLILKTALPIANAQTGGWAALQVAAIKLDGYAVDPLGTELTGAAAVAALLPQRGMVRIGDEYISYLSIVGDELRTCIRARRQDTNQNLAVGVVGAFPAAPAHAIGDLVVPGGYRYRPPATGRLYRGGCHLDQVLNNGDLVATDARRYTTWATLSPTAHADPMDPAQILLPAAQTTITLVAPGYPAAFPPNGGVVRIGAQFIAYTAAAGSVLNGCTGIDTWPSSAMHAPRTDQRWPLANPPTVQLISIRVAGPSALEDGRYAQLPANPKLLQITHPTTQRIEWIAYDAIVQPPSGAFSYFINANGFNNAARGIERTAFAGRDGVSPDPSLVPNLNPLTDVFPAGARVIPVQAECTSNWFTATGDVVTIAPTRTGIPAPPYQALVRYATTDGYSSTAGTTSGAWDTRNCYFAFNDALPVTFEPNTFELLCWPCWSARDLTTLNPVGTATLVPHLMPWATAFDSTFLVGGDDRQVCLGASDTRHGGPTASIDGILDTVCAGQQPGGQVGMPGTVQFGVPDPMDPMSISVATIPASGPVPASVIASTIGGEPVFRLPNNVSMGLVLIGGEVFAYRKIDDSRATLVARGLLGSTSVAHIAGEPILNLPIGPVATLVTPLPLDHQDLVALSDDRLFDCPAVLVCSPDGVEAEVLAMPNGATAPWLRGLYNSVPVAWTAPTGGGTAPVAIGWWPRFASALPGGGLREEHWRCRTYAWASFPARLRDSVFAGLGSDPLATVSVLDNGGIFDLAARARRDGFDWTVAGSVALSGPGADASGAFAAAPFAKPSDAGAELRVTWTYNQPPSSALVRIGEAGTRAPVLGQVRLRMLAPARVVAVEDAR